MATLNDLAQDLLTYSYIKSLRGVRREQFKPRVKSKSKSKTKAKPKTKGKKNVFENKVKGMTLEQLTELGRSLIKNG